MKTLIVLIVLVQLLCQVYAGKYGISASYPKDKNIGKNKHVLWAQDFGDGSLSSILDDISCPGRPDGLSLRSNTPKGARNQARSLRMSAVGKQNTGSGIYHVFAPDGVNSVYLRYYVRYNQNSRYHHTGGAIGSYNPVRTCPAGGAGYVPDNSVRVRFEPIGHGQTECTGRGCKMDFYAYFWGMHSGNGVRDCGSELDCDDTVCSDNQNPSRCSINDCRVSYECSQDTNLQYGNSLISPITESGDPNNEKLYFKPNKWYEVEVYLKLNTPGKKNGQLKLWINGKQRISMKKGSPNGFWIWDSFRPGCDPPNGCSDIPRGASALPWGSVDTGEPFEGFEWRNKNAVKLNFFRFEHYLEHWEAVDGRVSYAEVSNIVVAKKRIGSINQCTNSLINAANEFSNLTKRKDECKKAKCRWNSNKNKCAQHKA